MKTIYSFRHWNVRKITCSVQVSNPRHSSLLLKTGSLDNAIEEFSLALPSWYMYRKSYERECISRFMGTSDVLKVLKIARTVGECNLRTFKTSRVTINHEMHEQVHTIVSLLYSQQNYSNALLCTRYVLHKTLQWFPIGSHDLFEPIRNIMLWQGNQAWSFWRTLKKFRKCLES